MKFPIINRFFPSFKWKVAAVIIGGVIVGGGAAEIIPNEPDTVNTVVGIFSEYIAFFSCAFGHFRFP